MPNSGAREERTQILGRFFVFHSPVWEKILICSRPTDRQNEFNTSFILERLRHGNVTSYTWSRPLVFPLSRRVPASKTANVSEYLRNETKLPKRMVWSLTITLRSPLYSCNYVETLMLCLPTTRNFSRKINISRWERTLKQVRGEFHII